MDTEVEQGKMAIIAYVKEVMTTYSLDPSEFIFQWVEYFENAHWNLNIYRGKKTRHLSFREQDVEAWTRDAEVAGTYQPKVLKVVDWFLLNP